jgi:type I restriction enzyme R subunit
LDLGETDQLLFDQYEQEWLGNETLAAQARTNDLSNFRLVFDKVFMDTIVKRMDSNEEIFKKILDDDDFKDLLLDFYVNRLFTQFRQ